MELPSFTIQLDKLDLNHILNRDFGIEKTLPLWDLNNGNEYRQFELVAGRVDDDVAEDTANLETYKCILCNVDVPLVYRKEHNNSQKHKISIDIAKSALERVNANLAVIIEDVDVQKSSKTYFCEPCAVAVNVSDRQLHEKSEPHHDSVVHEKLINYLLMIYNDKENLNKIDEYFNEEEVISATDSEDSVFEDEMTDDDVASVDYTFLLTSTVSKDTNEEHLENVSDSGDNMKHYKLLLTTGQSDTAHKISFIGSDLVHIQTDDNNTLEVLFDNFNGLYTKTHTVTYTQCRICRMMVKGLKIEHVLMDEHIAKMKIPLESVHCYRQVDEKYKHCVLCNENFFDIEYHKELKVHKDALQNALKTTSPPVVKTNSANNTDVFTASVKALHENAPHANAPHENAPHENSKTLRQATSQIESPANQIKNTPVTKTNSKTDVSTTPKHKPQEIAQTNMPTTSKIVQNNVPKETNTPPIANSVKNSPKHPAKTFCKPCNLYIDTHNYASHAAGRFHMDMMRKEPLVTPNNSVKNSLKHPAKTFCKPCNLYIDSHNYASHAAGRFHMDMMREVPLATPNEPGPAKKIDTEKPKTEIKSTKKEIKQFLHHIDLIDGAAFVDCRVCESKMPNNGFNIQEHLEGGNHLKTYQNLLAKNKVKEHKRIYLCEACKIYVAFKTIFEHLASNEHKDYLKACETYNCPLCLVQVNNTGIVKVNHEATPRHNMRERCFKRDKIISKGCVVHPHYEPSLHEGNILCQICQKVVSVEGARDHLLSKSHISHYDTLVKDHKLQYTSDGYKCIICYESLKLEMFLNHITSVSHSMNKMFETKIRYEGPNEYYCSVCDVKIPNNPNNIKQHENSAVHQNKITTFAEVQLRAKEGNDWMVNIQGSSQVMCTLCMARVPEIATTEHVLGARHRNNEAAYRGSALK